MNWSFKSIIFLFAVSIFISCNAQKGKKAESNLRNEILNTEIAKIIEENTVNFPNNTQVSIALIGAEDTKFIGISRQKDTLKITDNKEKVFEIGSITKVFTNVLFSDLISKKRIALNETLKKQFDFELKNEAGKIQLQQLSNHTSGLPRLPSNLDKVVNFSMNDPYVNYTPQLLESYLKNEVVLENAIGKKSSYSNLGMGLLGYILTKKENKSLEELFQETIFKPLNMLSSTTELSVVDKSKLVKGLDKDGKEVPNWNFMDTTAGAGGIKSSAADLEKFIRKNFEDEAIYSLLQKETFAMNEKEKIGMGWQIIENDDFKILWHNGGTGGYRSCLAFNKKMKKGVIVLSNVSAMSSQSNKIDQLCFSLLKNN